MKRKTVITTAAYLSIQRPGDMTPAGRQAIARWLRNQAANLVRYGARYNSDGKYLARWRYEEKK